VGFETRQTLLQKIQSIYDENSWDEFDAIYRPYVTAVVRNFGLSESAIDDLVQDVMIRTWKGLPNFQYNPQKCLFRTWLSQICRNAVISFHRKRSSKQDRLTDNDEVALEQLTDENGIERLEKIAEEEWMVYIADLAWNNIKGRYQDNARSIYLMSLEGKSPRNIADSLGVAENTVYIYKKRLQIAMKKEIQMLTNF